VLIPTYLPLATITLTSTDSEIVFSSIPGIYRDLVLVISNAGSTGGTKTGLIINGDTGANYPFVRMYGFSGGAGSQAFSITGKMFDVGELSGSSTLISTTQLMDYAQTNKQKTGLTRWNSPTAWVAANAFRWASTAAITTLSLAPYDANTGNQSGSFTIGSTFSLYGVN